ncbi:hypothetical protein Pelo_18191 [Pelomyxa schiedti]|nr:hypothetical protein Pelo_18191 [Pelomyxa schiedti]
MRSSSCNLHSTQRSRRHLSNKQASSLDAEKQNALKQQEAALNAERKDALEQLQSALDAEKQKALEQQASSLDAEKQNAVNAEKLASSATLSELKQAMEGLLTERVSALLREKDFCLQVSHEEHARNIDEMEAKMKLQFSGTQERLASQIGTLSSQLESVRSSETTLMTQNQLLASEISSLQSHLEDALKQKAQRESQFPSLSGLFSKPSSSVKQTTDVAVLQEKLRLSEATLSKERTSLLQLSSKFKQVEEEKDVLQRKVRELVKEMDLVKQELEQAREANAVQRKHASAMIKLESARAEKISTECKQRLAILEQENETEKRKLSSEFQKKLEEADKRLQDLLAELSKAKQALEDHHQEAQAAAALYAKRLEQLGGKHADEIDMLYEDSYMQHFLMETVFHVEEPVFGVNSIPEPASLILGQIQKWEAATPLTTTRLSRVIQSLSYVSKSRCVSSCYWLSCVYHLIRTLYADAVSRHSDNLVPLTTEELNYVVAPGSCNAGEPTAYFIYQLRQVLFDGFRLLMRRTHTKIEPLVLQFLSKKEDSDGAKTKHHIVLQERSQRVCTNLVFVLDRILYRFASSKVVTSLTLQFFCHISHIINCILFNALMENPHFCTGTNGVQIKYGLALLDDYFEQIPGLVKAKFFLEHLREAANFLLGDKNVLLNPTYCSKAFPTLSMGQLARLALSFVPDSASPKPINSAVITTMREYLHSPLPLLLDPDELVFPVKPGKKPATTSSSVSPSSRTTTTNSSSPTSTASSSSSSSSVPKSVHFP